MEISTYLIWNVIITLVLAPLLFSIRKNEAEAKRIDILLNKTREEIAREYVTKQEVKEDITGSFKQYPMRLAWAITIHKSQGQTFEKVIIDMSQGSFAPGQLYVALSRCISLEGIELLRPIKKSDIIVNNQLIGFQDRLI